MANLTGNVPASTYQDLITITTAGGSGMTTTLSALQDGLGVASPLFLATDALNIDRSASTFQIDGVAVTSDSVDINSMSAPNPIALGTASLTLPVGTTAGRPGTPANGMIRYNSDLALIESYENSAWVTTGGGGTVTSVAASGSTGLTVGGSPITTSGTITLTLGTELQALSALSGTGFVAHTAANTYSERTLTGTASRLTVTNGDGIAGNPTLDISSSYVGQASISTLGTITTGTWTGTTVAVTSGGTGLATTTINELLYSSGADTIAGLATGNDGVLITSAGGVPSISSTIPAATQDNITRLGTIASIGAPLGSDFGGTGVTNAAGSTITLGGALSTVGAFTADFTMTANTAVTFPTSGTLSTTVGTVTSVSGAANEIDVATATTTPALTLSSTLVAPGTVTINALTTLTDRLLLDHTVIAPFTHCMDIECDAAGFSDSLAIAVTYTTGGIAAGETAAVIGVNIDESASTGGIIAAYSAIGAPGLTDYYGLAVGPGINVAIQATGTFGNIGIGLVKAVDETADLNNDAVTTSAFIADNDTVTIGDAAQFESIDFVLDTGASGSGIAPTFEYSDGVASWATFTPGDGTNGMRNSGQVGFLASDIPLWVTGTGGDYLIRITRTRNSLSTTPILEQVQISAVTIHTWNSVGDLAVASVDIDASNAYSVAGTNILSDAAGVMTLSNVDKLDPTTAKTMDIVTYAADAGGDDTYAITLDPVPAAYYDGMAIKAKLTTANTGAATMNVNALGAIAINKLNDQALVTGDIEANQIIDLVYNSTGPKFQMQSQAASAGGAVISVTGTASRISSTGGTTPVIDIDAAYVGQASITTLGTITTGTWDATDVALAHGGTNASLTADNGGLVYSDASGMAILAATATANQIPLSGSNVAPAWSTATYPATTTVSQILYSSATNTIAGLATGNDGVLITGATGIPSISSTIPNATQDNITRLGTIASIGAPLGADFGGTGVTNLAGSTITLGGALSTVGAFTAAFTMSANTAVTFPTTGTLSTTVGTVTSVSGAANQIDVATATTTPALTLSSTMVAPGTLGITTITANRAVATDGSNVLVSSATTDTELGYVNGVTSAIQTQLGTKVTQTGAEIFAADAQASDTYVITLSPVPGGYTTGMVVNFSATTINTAGATINVNSLGAKAILKNKDRVLNDGDIKAGQFVSLIYDGTQFQMQSQAGNSTYDIAFIAGFDSVMVKSNAVVQVYGQCVMSRTGTFVGEAGYADTAPTDASCILDIRKNGTTIYSTLPEFATTSQTLTAGVIKSDGTEDFVAGDRITFQITQIGSTLPGQGIRFTVNGIV